MKTEMINSNPVTSLRPESKRKLLHLINKLVPHTKTPKLGRWKALSNEELWSHIVSQVCVMGSARPMEKLKQSSSRLEFDAALSLKSISNIMQEDKSIYIEDQLKRFKATRFYNKAACRLAEATTNLKIVEGTRLVLLNDLPHGDDYAVREELIKRSIGLFKLKSVSDLMIALGLSHDVIALDQRVVGVLNACLGYNWKAPRLQNNRSIYLSVEDCLRDVCKDASISLGSLDRMLFNFAGLTAIEYIMHLDLSSCDLAS